MDVGSNSIRLVVAEVGAGGDYRILDERRRMTRLARGTWRSDALDQTAMIESARAITELHRVAEGLHVDRFCAVATCAVREANNRRAFIELVAREAEVELEVISSEEEARLALVSVRHHFDLPPGLIAVVDIGGGSTEIILSAAGRIEQTYSVSLGAVRLTEMFTDSDLDHEQRLANMRHTVEGELDSALAATSLQSQLMVGTGGTFTALAYLQGHEQTTDVQGMQIQRPTVQHFIEHLSPLTPEQRRETPGLSADRGDIIVAGLVIADSVMQRLGIDSLLVHDRGIRDGMVLELIRQHRESSAI